MAAATPRKGAKSAKAASIKGKGASPLPNEAKRRERRAKELVAGQGYNTRDFNNKRGNRYSTK